MANARLSNSRSLCPRVFFLWLETLCNRDVKPEFIHSQQSSKSIKRIYFKTFIFCGCFRDIHYPCDRCCTGQHSCISNLFLLFFVIYDLGYTVVVCCLLSKCIFFFSFFLLKTYFLQVQDWCSLPTPKQ